MEVDAAHPANVGVLKYLEGRTPPSSPLTCSPSSVKNPYYTLGSHPDIVERLWEQLQAALPVDCRWIVYRTPVLLHPRGIVLAAALGTTYAIRLTEEHLKVGIARGAKTLNRYAGGRELDVQREFGDDWIFGGWFSEEAAWCRAAYDAFLISK